MIGNEVACTESERTTTRHATRAVVDRFDTALVKYVAEGMVLPAKDRLSIGCVVLEI